MGRQARERLHPLYELLRAEAASMKAGLLSDIHPLNGCVLPARDATPIPAMDVCFRPILLKNSIARRDWSRLQGR